MGGNVLKIVLNEVQGQGTNIQTVENFQLKKTTHSQLLLMPSSLHIHNIDMWIRNYAKMKRLI
jgi:ribosomal protein L2